MRQARKEALLHSFPEVPARFMQQMQDGKRSENFALMLTLGEELFVRCFHRYGRGYKNALAEVQRYVFAKDGSVRYGVDDCGKWQIRSEVREPVFYQQPYGYADKTYRVLNPEAIKKSDMKFCCYEDAPELLIEYLHLYCRHPNVEYLLKSGYKHLIAVRCTGWWGNKMYLQCSECINWKSNDLLKMLRLNRAEFKLLEGREKLYETYIMWREVFPKIKPEGLLTIAEQFRSENGTMQEVCKETGLKPDRLARYLKQHNIRTWDYRDYISQCRKLRYDLRDTSISMPRRFKEMHTRLSDLVKYNATQEMQKHFAEHVAKRKGLEFAFGALMIRQPESVQEIIDEGKALHHCVGGYAERHAKGALHIMFIRTADKPDVPYYTMEISTEGKIVQVRGLRNCNPTAAVKALIAAYTEYLAGIFGTQKARKTA